MPFINAWTGFLAYGRVKLVSNLELVIVPIKQLEGVESLYWLGLDSAPHHITYL